MSMQISLTEKQKVEFKDLTMGGNRNRTYKLSK